MRLSYRFGFSLALLWGVSGCPGVVPPPEPGLDDAKVRAEIEKWNGIAVDASGVDHIQLADTGTASAPGPVLSARAMAIAHIAMADVVGAATGEFLPYSRLLTAEAGASVEAGIAQAAHDTLVALYPQQAATFDAALAESLDTVEEGAAKDAGMALGAASAG
jgi:hypothetical protein